MGIRVRVDRGTLIPLDPLPPEWVEGAEVEIEYNGRPDDAPVGDADWLTEEEHARLQARLDEQRRLAKEYMRKVMGLPE